jgi:hypothetical protein
MVAMSPDQGRTWTTLSFEAYPFRGGGPARGSFPSSVRTFFTAPAGAAQRVYAVQYSDGYFVYLARSDDGRLSWGLLQTRAPAISVIQMRRRRRFTFQRPP